MPGCDGSPMDDSGRNRPGHTSRLYRVHRQAAHRPVQDGTKAVKKNIAGYLTGVRQPAYFVACDERLEDPTTGITRRTSPPLSRRSDTLPGPARRRKARLAHELARIARV